MSRRREYVAALEFWREHVPGAYGEFYRRALCVSRTADLPAEIRAAAHKLGISSTRSKCAASILRKVRCADCANCREQFGDLIVGLDWRWRVCDARVEDFREYAVDRPRVCARFEAL